MASETIRFYGPTRGHNTISQVEETAEPSGSITDLFRILRTRKVSKLGVEPGLLWTPRDEHLPDPKYMKLANEWLKRTGSPSYLWLVKSAVGQPRFIRGVHLMAKRNRIQLVELRSPMADAIYLLNHAVLEAVLTCAQAKNERSLPPIPAVLNKIVKERRTDTHFTSQEHALMAKSVAALLQAKPDLSFAELYDLHQALGVERSNLMFRDAQRRGIVDVLAGDHHGNDLHEQRMNIVRVPISSGPQEAPEFTRERLDTYVRVKPVIERVKVLMRKEKR